MGASSSRPPKKSQLLELSDELLLAILINIEGSRRNEALRHVALTCRRLRYIASEALIRIAVVSPRSLQRYIALLFQYPEHANKITHLQIGPWGESRAQQVIMNRDAEENLIACRAVIKATAESDKAREWIKALESGKHDGGSIFDSISEATLAVLLVMIPKLQTITIDTRNIDYCILLYALFSVGNPDLIFFHSYEGPEQRHWSHSVKQHLKPTLRTLHITGRTPHQHGEVILQNTQLNIKQLSLPAEHILRYHAELETDEMMMNLNWVRIFLDVSYNRYKAYLEFSKMMRWLANFAEKAEDQFNIARIQICLRCTLSSLEEEIQQQPWKKESLSLVISKCKKTVLETYVVRHDVSYTQDEDLWSEYCYVDLVQHFQLQVSNI
ncbi:hypothetical protein B0J11DRAFT_619398 [Dendryphion nanum]|uniref:F-box domain-containing protein n=1 Tax=Dendryphion nanum TaxID=256645 RepID=A0A9P9I9P9_9PLEO|nr:hypothetical protein B0J11DRAFT_619398 [Dendryphion nanum]